MRNQANKYEVEIAKELSSQIVEMLTGKVLKDIASSKYRYNFESATFEIFKFVFINRLTNQISTLFHGLIISRYTSLNLDREAELIYEQNLKAIKGTELSKYLSSSKNHGGFRSYIIGESRRFENRLQLDAYNSELWTEFKEKAEEIRKRNGRGGK